MSSNLLSDENLIHIMQFLPTNQKNKPISKIINNQFFTQNELLIKAIFNINKILKQKTNNNLQVVALQKWLKFNNRFYLGNVKNIKYSIDNFKKVIKLRIEISAHLFKINFLNNFKLWKSNLLKSNLLDEKKSHNLLNKYFIEYSTNIVQSEIKQTNNLIIDIYAISPNIGKKIYEFWICFRHK